MIWKLDCLLPGSVGFPEKARKILNHPLLLAPSRSKPWQNKCGTEYRISLSRPNIFIFGEEETHLSLTVLGNVSIANSSIPVVLWRERWSTVDNMEEHCSIRRIIRRGAGAEHSKPTTWPPICSIIAMCRTDANRNRPPEITWSWLNTHPLGDIGVKKLKLCSFVW